MCEKWIHSIPVVSRCNAIGILLLNMIIPGFGTMILACMSPYINGELMLVGILQFIFWPFFLIGLFWAIWWSMLVLHKSGSTPEIIVNPQNVVHLKGAPYNIINPSQNAYYLNIRSDDLNRQTKHLDSGNAKVQE